jgi:hypothetical protein
VKTENQETTQKTEADASLQMAQVMELTAADPEHLDLDLAIEEFEDLDAPVAADVACATSTSCKCTSSSCVIY